MATAIDKTYRPVDTTVPRLNLLQWIAVAVIVLAVMQFAPRQAAERLPAFAADYRLPFEMSQDYWLAKQHQLAAVEQSQIIMLGDSVIWGEYVSPNQTLSAYLNQTHASNSFTNQGINGMHPLAIEGLAQNVLSWQSGQPVMLHLNLLWTSSPERDLNVDKQLSFNHETLVPQFRSIPSYKATLEDRVSIAIQRGWNFRQWVKHLRIGYFDSKDLHSWSLAHPYQNPLNQFDRALPSPKTELRHEPIPWYESGIQPQSFPWVELDDSLQWQSLLRNVDFLTKQQCRVIVLVGPFNEHLLEPANRAVYQERKLSAVSILTNKNITVLDSPLLPSEEYGDASHPLSSGYERWAKWLTDNADFQNWLTQ